MLIGRNTFARPGDLETVREFWPHVHAGCKWIDITATRPRRFCRNDGAAPNGLVNQGGKDSVDAIFHEYRSCPTARSALCEVQGYVFAAKRHPAVLACALVDTAKATRPTSKPSNCAAFRGGGVLGEDLSTYALAPRWGETSLSVWLPRTAGHALLTGIVRSRRAQRVRRHIARRRLLFPAGASRPVAPRRDGLTRSRTTTLVWPSRQTAMIASGGALWVRMKSCASSPCCAARIV